MTERMAKLDRALVLVHCLADSSEGLTLDEMAEALGVNRRTAERMRDIIALHFELDEVVDDRRKRFRIRGSLRRVYTRPNAAELAALQIEAEARRRESAPQAELLESLLAKVKGALDSKEKSRLDPDLEPLARLQRSMFQMGERSETNPEVLALLQQAIMAGVCAEFEYLAADFDVPKWRRVIPYGLILGPVTYLVGKFPDSERDPVPFRLDRMSEVRCSDHLGSPSDDWNLDTWMEQSVSIWREEEQDIVLRVLPDAVERARNWQFHPHQAIEEDGECLLIRFRSGGLWQIADHVFTWGGGLVIEGPESLREVMRERVEAAVLTCQFTPSEQS